MVPELRKARLAVQGKGKEHRLAACLRGLEKNTGWQPVLREMEKNTGWQPVLRGMERIGLAVGSLLQGRIEIPPYRLGSISLSFP